MSWLDLTSIREKKNSCTHYWASRHFDVWAWAHLNGCIWYFHCENEQPSINRWVLSASVLLQPSGTSSIKLIWLCTLWNSIIVKMCAFCCFSQILLSRGTNIDGSIGRIKMPYLSIYHSPKERNISNVSLYMTSSKSAIFIVRIILFSIIYCCSFLILLSFRHGNGLYYLRNMSKSRFFGKGSYGYWKNECNTHEVREEKDSKMEYKKNWMRLNWLKMLYIEPIYPENVGILLIKCWNICWGLDSRFNWQLESNTPKNITELNWKLIWFGGGNKRFEIAQFNQKLADLHRIKRHKCCAQRQ